MKVCVSARVNAALNLALRAACILSVCLIWRAASAFGIPDALSDPLLTKPAILKMGPSLPDGAPIECHTQTDLSQPLALGEIIDLALCNNPQIKQAWTTIKIQAAALGESRAAYLPTASATYSPQQTQVNYPQSSYNANTITNGKQSYANLNWRLFDFGGRAANRISANLLLEAALATHDATIQKIMAGIIQSYFDALTARASVKAKARAAAFAESSLGATLRRENKGASAKSDTLQAQAALAKAQLASSRAAGDYRKAQAALIFAMGVPTSSKLILQDDDGDLQNWGLKALNEWLEEAEQWHPAIKAALAQRDSAKEKIAAASAAGLPTIDFVGNFYQNGYPNQGIQPTKSNTTTVGLTLTIPIFEGFGTTYKIRGAQAQAEKAQAELEDAKHQLLTEIVKSYSDAVSSLSNLEASKRLLEAANAAVQSSIRRYDKGAADILELLTAETTLAEAQEERIRCIAEYRSARLRLMANAGVMGRNLQSESGYVAPLQPSFKAEAPLTTVAEDGVLVESRQHNVSPSQISEWKDLLTERAINVFVGEPNTRP